MTPPAAMLQALGGALHVNSGSQAHLTGCIITNSAASSSGSEVRHAPQLMRERTRGGGAAHEASPHQPAAICPCPL